MRATCPACGHRFTREPGFFQGAMFVGYAVGVAELIVGSTIAYVFLSPHTRVVLAPAAAGVVHLLLGPQLFEYCRVIWAHVVAGRRTADLPRHRVIPESGLRAGNFPLPRSCKHIRVEARPCTSPAPATAPGRHRIPGPANPRPERHRRHQTGCCRPGVWPP